MAQNIRELQLSNIKTLQIHDVVCRQGGNITNHMGNVHWRALVLDNKQLYITLPKKKKKLLARSIVAAIRTQVPPGRFLAKDKASDSWYDIGDDKATDKTGQALREGAPRIREMLTTNRENQHAQNRQEGSSSSSNSSNSNSRKQAPAPSTTRVARMPPPPPQPPQLLQPGYNAPTVNGLPVVVYPPMFATFGQEVLPCRPTSPQARPVAPRQKRKSSSSTISENNDSNKAKRRSKKKVPKSSRPSTAGPPNMDIAPPSILRTKSAPATSIVNQNLHHESNANQVSNPPSRRKSEDHNADDSNDARQNQNSLQQITPPPKKRAPRATTSKSSKAVVSAGRKLAAATATAATNDSSSINNSKMADLDTTTAGAKTTDPSCMMQAPRVQKQIKLESILQARPSSLGMVDPRIRSRPRASLRREPKPSMLFDHQEMHEPLDHRPLRLLPRSKTACKNYRPNNGLVNNTTPRRLLPLPLPLPTPLPTQLNHPKPPGLSHILRHHSADSISQATRKHIDSKQKSLIDSDDEEEDTDDTRRFAIGFGQEVRKQWEQEKKSLEAKHDDPAIQKVVGRDLSSSSSVKSGLSAPSKERSVSLSDIASIATENSMGSTLTSTIGQSGSGFASLDACGLSHHTHNKACDNDHVDNDECKGALDEKKPSASELKQMRNSNNDDGEQGDDEDDDNSQPWDDDDDDDDDENPTPMQWESTLLETTTATMSTVSRGAINRSCMPPPQRNGGAAGIINPQPQQQQLPPDIFFYRCSLDDGPQAYNDNSNNSDNNNHNSDNLFQSNFLQPTDELLERTMLDRGPSLALEDFGHDLNNDFGHDLIDDRKK